jgi:Leucine-rich repeat (LRR) protein
MPKMLDPDDLRMPRSARFDMSSPRASSENNRENVPTPDIQSLMQDSPPRKRTDKIGSTVSTSTPMLSTEETAELFRAKLAEAQQHNEQALDKEGVNDVLKPKITLDLGHSSIQRLPEAVIDLIKDEVDRLSLSQNQIWYIPLRIQECVHIRYLNIRHNAFREIPRGVFKLPNLEILDISRNKVKTIPPDISGLTSLRVLSITENKITDLPTEICDMTMLEMMRIGNNPLRENLAKVIEAKKAEVSFLEMNGQEREKTITVEIKRHLRASKPPKAPPPLAIAPIDVDAAQQYEESPMETPKPAKRAPSSRFPVIPSTGNSDGTSPPNQANPPPIPTRSHFRMTSGQGMAIKRPGITPLISGTGFRSNSEATFQNPRSKRMGMLQKRTQIDSLEDARANRNSHLRGFSHASALKKGGVPPSPGVSIGTASPSSPRNRSNPFNRRLSSLPEYKVEDEWQNPVIQGAKGMLYALFQIHPQVSGLLAAIRGPEAKRSSLEIVFYHASTHIDRLNDVLERADATHPENIEAIQAAEARVREDCANCITAYTQVADSLQAGIKRLIGGSDPRYVRTLMLLLYGSILEIRNAISSLNIEVKVLPTYHKRQRSSGSKHPIQTIPEESTDMRRVATPTREGVVHQRPGMRLRSDTTIQHTPPDGTITPQSLNLTGTTVNGSTYTSMNSSYASARTLNGSNSSSRSRSNSRNASQVSSLASSAVGTPRSSEGFHLPRSTSYFAQINQATGLTESQEEAHFGQIFMSLTSAYEAALRNVPVAREHFLRCLEAAREGQQTRAIQQLWSALVYRCQQCHDVSEALQMRLTSMRIKDEGGRSDPSFWLLCKTFLQNFVDLLTEVREVRNLRLLPQELLVILRPLQKTSREAGRLIQQSPWRTLTDGVPFVPAPTPYTSASAMAPPARSDSFAVPSNTLPVRNDSYSYLSAAANGHGYLQSRDNHTVSSSTAIAPQLLRMHTSPSVITTTAPAVQPLSGQIPDSASVPGFDRMQGPSPLTSPLPATPLSAALGPAAQATIPTSAPPTAVPTSANPMSAALAMGPGWTIKPNYREDRGDMPPTPATASMVSGGFGGTERSNVSGFGSSDNLFRGDVFQRADTLLNMPVTGTGINWSIRR